MMFFKAEINVKNKTFLWNFLSPKKKKIKEYLLESFRDSGQDTALAISNLTA